MLVESLEDPENHARGGGLKSVVQATDHAMYLTKPAGKEVYRFAEGSDADAQFSPAVF